jgi:serine/threonine-protein kinase
MTMEAGDRLSHYRIVGRLGQGGMGVVYRAEDVRLGRPVALKVLAPHLAGNWVARRRFEAEAKAASALDHPNICALYDVGETPDGGLFLALAFCEGETLRELLDRAPIEPARAFMIAAQIAEGLADAHDKGIVHRDVKPANVMVRPDGLVKILDFGVARLERDAGLTGPTDSVGSPAYMAPEQIESARVGPSADLWALGVVLYEMISGRRPFEADGLRETLHRVLTYSPPPLHEIRPGVHPEVSRLVARALAKDPAARFASARELAMELRAAAAGGTDATRTVPPLAASARPTTPVPAPTSVPSPQPAPSLAVLPFSDLSPERDQSWFCEGLAEELITALSEVSGLRVASRASTLQFRDQDPRAIGEKLQVGTLLTGSVRKAGNRLRIATQLVAVADGSVLASSRYDHDLDDVFALQDAIARAAVETVLARIGRRATAPRVRRPTASIEAYNLYLKGRYHWNRRSVSGFRTAIPLFEQAIEIDPEFAGAYVGLADVHLQLALFNAMRPHTAAERGRELCQRALALDPEHAEGITTLATIHALHDWEWSHAEAELSSVVARNPECTKARQALALYVLAPLRRFDEAIAELRAALAADPISIPLNISLGFVQHWARRSEEALALVRSLLDLGHEDSFTRVVLSEILTDLGRPQEGVAALLGTRHPLTGPNAALAICQARAGSVDEAKAVIEQLLSPPGGVYAPTYFPALVCIGLGDLEQALDLLERAVEERTPQAVWLGVRPIFDPLRGQPRFLRLLERVRLPTVRPAISSGP